MANKFHTQSKIRLYSTRIASCSAIALVLAASPVIFDLQTGELSYQSAMAKSCFTADTKVRMADGRLKNIDAVKIGDRVIGLDGSINTVLGVEKVPLGRRRLYGFNSEEAFVTAEHPFYTLEGWKSLDPERTAFENTMLFVQRLTVGDGLLIWSASPP